MTTAILPPPAIDRFVEPLQHAVNPITQVRNALGALPAPTMPQDLMVATTVDDLASTHVIDARTLVVIARKDRHIPPIAAMITEHLPRVTTTIVGSAITATLT
ncbi:hypothetical protein NLM24_24040 [Nocardia zapadnayensis]|uniref:hypothetical protein n=1 Tax=Nocardia rhamnosiphila TaxID=426716 RepID=UPI002247F6D3|nr:hypothetical protein [Nocardia zapadnayensis]MCX0273708.1 hypothetical protein [Nocardia zapadnayensis]